MARFRLFAAVLAAATLHAEGPRAFAEDQEVEGPFANLEWRNVGPVNAESREALVAYNAFLAELVVLNESLLQNELPVILVPDSLGLEAF